MWPMDSGDESSTALGGIATLTIKVFILEWDGQILWDLYSGETIDEKEITSESSWIPHGILRVEGLAI